MQADQALLMIIFNTVFNHKAPVSFNEYMIEDDQEAIATGAFTEGEELLAILVLWRWWDNRLGR